MVIKWPRGSRCGVKKFSLLWDCFAKYVTYSQQLELIRMSYVLFQWWKQEENSPCCPSLLIVQSSAVQVIVYYTSQSVVVCALLCRRNLHDRTEIEFTVCKHASDSWLCFCSFAVESERSHRCGLSCLGPLTFHHQAVGDKVSLSQGCRLAERTADTFRHGLVFSSRQVKVQERIRLRVEKDTPKWHGALRVGFTNVPPLDRSLPLPGMAIPNLTKISGHWAAPVHESYCRAGSELEFWVSSGGNLYVTSNNTRKHKLLTGVDLSKPLWAMIDIYGQTCSIFLLG